MKLRITIKFRAFFVTFGETSCTVPVKTLLKPVLAQFPNIRNVPGEAIIDLLKPEREFLVFDERGIKIDLIP